MFARFRFSMLATLLAAVLATAAPEPVAAGFIPPDADALVGAVSFKGVRTPSQSGYVASYDALAGSFAVEVFSVVGDPHSVIFSIVNNYSGSQLVGPTIGGIFFDDRVPALLELSSLLEMTGVDFKDGAGGSNLPGGENLTPAFDTTLDFYANTDKSAENGIDPNEGLGIRFSLLGSHTASDVLAALLDGTDLRIGIHVQRLDGNPGSYGFVTTPPPSDIPKVPEPGTFALLALGAVGLSGYARRRRSA